MIFLTVGSEFPFDRLVKAVDDMIGAGKMPDKVFAQVGRSGYQPCHMPWVPMMELQVYGQRLKAAAAVIAHAGMGTIADCLELKKPLLVMPRLSRFGEAVNDHQIQTALRFEERGQILVADNETNLEEKMEKLLDFHPKTHPKETQSLVNCIREFLDKLDS